jgi:hypothetical protein
VSKQTEWFSRDQWHDRGRAVVVDNSEARGVTNYWEGHAGLHRGAWHVFSEDQTLPVEQLHQVGVAA